MKLWLKNTIAPVLLVTLLAITGSFFLMLPRNKLPAT